ncbi:NAD-dependent epimerase/dehydratase family protein [Okeania sp.]|uniref:NAD-dependent epimerase/dehydratase family protein n=1 Tax=Okeania sp. TaxID=3100323 RepID=UPI002B4B3893|nr:NAD-dependent epimerase/dehydratase family protein [Okeania sp.]MEB3340307.1 NAD-dependent epimerase/dehydratase family protein [Okeania sp.]
MNVMSSALVTGGSGYFGSLLVKKLLEKGISCSILDIIDAPDRPANVKLFQCDIRDAEAVKAACQNVDVVYHSVAQVPLAKNKELFNSVNIQGTENVLAAALANSVKKVVYTSSSSIFGIPKKNPVTEADIPKPLEAYGKAKLEGEHLCKSYIQQGLDVSIIRPRTMLGHGRLGIFQILFEWIRQGYNVPVLGKGDNRYQFVHSDDLAEACILAASRPGSELYNCGTDRFGTMRALLEALCQHAKTGSIVKGLPAKPTIWAMKATSALGVSPLGIYHAMLYGGEMYFDISKATTELGWQPQYSNSEMLIQSYEWYLANRENVLSSSGGSPHRSPVKQGVLNAVKWIL